MWIPRLRERCMFDAGSAPRPGAYPPLAAVSATSVGSLANHSLCKCEAVLRQYGGGGRLLAQSITMRRVYQPDNQQTQLLVPCLRRPSKWELQSAPFRMILRPESVAYPPAPSSNPVTPHPSAPAPCLQLLSDASRQVMQLLFAN